MRVIKVVSKKTYKNKDGKERHYVNFYVECDNGTRISIIPNPHIEISYTQLNAVAETDGK